MFDFSEDLFQEIKHTKQRLSREQWRRAKRQRISSIGEKEKAIYKAQEEDLEVQHWRKEEDSSRICVKQGVYFLYGNVEKRESSMNN